MERWRKGKWCNFLQQKKCFCSNIDGDKLGHNHNYFYQIQGQLVLYGLEWAVVIWTNKKRPSIDKNNILLSFHLGKYATKQQLKSFYTRAMVNSNWTTIIILLLSDSRPASSILFGMDRFCNMDQKKTAQH